jgi:hypothetical protein
LLALIDTGALITGMSNLEVAKFLLEHGLPSLLGVVYLADDDTKMIYERRTHKAIKLEDSSIPVNKRCVPGSQPSPTRTPLSHLALKFTAIALADSPFTTRFTRQAQTSNTHRMRLRV